MLNNNLSILRYVIKVFLLGEVVEVQPQSASRLFLTDYVQHLFYLDTFTCLALNMPQSGLQQSNKVYIGRQ